VLAERRFIDSCVDSRASTPSRTQPRGEGRPSCAIFTWRWAHIVLLCGLHGKQHVVHAVWVTLSRTLNKAEEALSRALDGYAPARIAWPSPSHQTELARLVEAREPLLRHTFGFIDGVTGLRATHQLGATHKLCVTHLLSINQISVGGLTANEYALDWVTLC